jgi:hypothetical protein
MSQSMLDAAKSSLVEAERIEDEIGPFDRSPKREYRDELLLANAQASIAIAEALTCDAEPDCEDACECDGEWAATPTEFDPTRRRVSLTLLNGDRFEGALERVG